MKESKLINELKGIGLTGSEAKVYFYLLKKKNFTATEISKLAQIPQSKIYGILAKLVQKGLCTEILGKIKKYSSVNPEVGFVNLYNELEDKKKRISDLSKVLLPLYNSEKENSDPLDYIQVLREKSRIAEKFCFLERKAKKEVLCFTKQPYAFNLEKNEEGFNLKKRGIIVKSIYEIDDARKLDFFKWIEMYANVGEEIRISYGLPLKLVIFDEKIVLIALRDRLTSKQSLTSLLIEHPDFANAFKKLFEGYWQNSMTLEEFKMKEKIT